MQNLEMQKTSNCSHWYFYKKNRQTFCVFFFSFFVTVFYFTFLSFFFWGIVLLYSSGWPGIQYGQAGLELMAIPLPLQCRDNRLELGVWLQGTALAYSLLKDLGFIPSIVFSFSTNKQHHWSWLTAHIWNTHTATQDLQRLWEYFMSVTDWWKESPWLTHPYRYWLHFSAIF